MDIKKKEEIGNALAQNVLSASPNSKEYETAVNAYNSWLKTLNELERTEAELRMKQNAMDDDLQNKRDEMLDKIEARNQEIESKRADDIRKAEEEKKRLYVEIAKWAASTIGTLVMCWGIIKSTNAELSGYPLLGAAKQFNGQSLRLIVKK